MEYLEQLAQKILEAAKTAGADAALCVTRETETREFNLFNGEFSLLRTLFDRSVQLSLIKDRRKGSVEINSFDDAAVQKAVADCIASAESAEPDAAWEFDSEPRDETNEVGPLVCDAEALFARTKELAEEVAKRHPKIVLEECYAKHIVTRAVCRTSGGVTSRSAEGCYQLSLSYSAHEGDKSSSFYYGDLMLPSLDRPFLDCGLIEWELSALERQVDNAPLDGKFTGTVILAPNALAELILSTVQWNFISDDPLIDGTSIWKDKLGQPVADPRLSLSFAPRAADVVAGDRWTDEGYPAENWEVIRDGRLVGFMLSQYGANKTGGVRAACPVNRWLPWPHIPAGERSLDEIIAGIERGVLVMRFSGGEPAPNGEFSGVAKNSFLIENGKLSHALSETMISGSVADMLQKLRALSRETLRDGGCSLPFIAFDGVTVSGK